MANLAALLGKVSGGATVNPNQEVSASEWNTLVSCVLALVNASSEVYVSDQDEIIGLKDGTNRIFTVPSGSYRPGSLLLHIQGNEYSNGNGLTETDPANGQFTVDVGNEPSNVDQMTAIYGVQVQ